MASNVSTLGVSANFGKFFGSLVSNSAGFAMGIAVGPTLHPAVRYLENEAWQRFPTKPLDYQMAAAIAAEDRSLEDFMRAEGEKQGIAAEKMNQVLHALRGGPGAAMGLELWRRGLMGEDGMDRALWEAKLEEVFHVPIKGLKRVLLSASDLAQARQRGFVDAAKQLDESQAQGLTRADAEILFETAGLPPPTERAREMWRRGIIGEPEFRQTIVEGNEKLKYRDEEAALFWEVLGASTYADLHLRGWIDEAEMNAGGRLSGHRPEDMQRLFHARGRPATTHQAFIGNRRGGVYDGPTAGIPDWFQKAVRQSNIRDEWLNILWAQRYSYPSAFVLRGLTQSGDLTQDEAHTILLNIGWEPGLATKVSARWAGGTGAATSPYVAKADTHLWTTLHRSYVAFDTTAAQARNAMATLGIPTDARQPILDRWNAERDLIRRELTPAQVKKAFAKPITNRATGQPWTRDDAIAALIERGYSAAEANEFLDL